MNEAMIFITGTVVGFVAATVFYVFICYQLTEFNRKRCQGVVEWKGLRTGIKGGYQPEGPGLDVTNPPKGVREYPK